MIAVTHRFKSHTESSPQTVIVKHYLSSMMLTNWVQLLKINDIVS